MTDILASLGWPATKSWRDPLHELGRVLRADRGASTVCTAAGEIRAALGGTVLAAAHGDPVALPCAGDWVAVRRWPDKRVTIECVLPRKSAIVRRTAGKQATGQVLAANLDVAAVVASLDPTPELETIERLLSLAWDSGAKPYLILTKADLVRDPSAVARQLAEIAPRVPTLAVSAVRGDGLDVLRPFVAFGRTLGLIGASGAGKSSLVNALAVTAFPDAAAAHPPELQPTQAIRRADGKGRHTTTYRALVPIPGGGAVLDTPGIRSVGLLEGITGLDRAFADVHELAAQCRFPDCTHAGEPGCAVTLALASGELSYRRWASWLKLLRELEFERRRANKRPTSRTGGTPASRRRRGRH
jgi:ribosome biogenesis GTPase